MVGLGCLRVPVWPQQVRPHPADGQPV